MKGNLALSLVAATHCCTCCTSGEADFTRSSETGSGASVCTPEYSSGIGGGGGGGSTGTTTGGGGGGGGGAFFLLNQPASAAPETRTRLSARIRKEGCVAMRAIDNK